MSSECASRIIVTASSHFIAPCCERSEIEDVVTLFGINLIDALQWPAMVVTVLASWLVASSQSSRRNVGFWVFICSNVLWITWGVYSVAPALVTLQLCLAVMNIRGARKT